jgi:hypothetical protein
MFKPSKSRVRVVKKAEDNIETIRQQNEVIIEGTLEIYELACREGLIKTADNYHVFLKHLSAVQRVLEAKLDASMQQVMSNISRYILSSRRARKIYDSLMDDSGDEKFVYCTGVIEKTANIYVPTEVLAPKMAERSPVHAIGDQRSINDLLCSLGDTGHTILLKCQRHPGSGLSAINPSNVDLSTHRDLEVCYPVIGAIFVRDGYFRFFSHTRKYKVDIYGRGVRRIDDRTFRFEN